MIIIQLFKNEEKLIKKALQKGGHDNVTVAIVSAPKRLNLSTRLQRMALKSPLLSPFVNNAKDKKRLLILILAALLCGLTALVLKNIQFI